MSCPDAHAILLRRALPGLRGPQVGALAPEIEQGGVRRDTGEPVVGWAYDRGNAGLTMPLGRKAEVSVFGHAGGKREWGWRYISV